MKSSSTIICNNTLITYSQNGNADSVKALTRNYVFLSVYYYHVMCEFQRQSTLYSLPECQGIPCSKQAPYLASLAKWLSGNLQTKWLWVRISFLSLKLQIWCLLQAKSSLTFRQTIEYGFTLKLVHDMIITYSQKF